MQRFTRLFFDLDATNATGEKRSLLETYFRHVPPRDGAWALALLAGHRPRGATSTRVLRDLAIEHSHIPAWLFDESYAAVGDLSETIALLLPEHAEPSDEPLHVTIESRVLPLITSTEQQRRRIIERAWAEFDADQRFVYHKLIRGGFRLGVQKRLLTRALAAAAEVPQDVMARRLTGAIEPSETWFRQIMSQVSGADESSRPYPFYLAHQLDHDPPTLGDVDQWQAEWKWDGIRAQLLLRNEAAIWSRGEELITHVFPELAQAGATLDINAVLDGEILLWQDDRALSFNALQKRLNRKVAPQPSLFDRQRPVFLAFDILEHEGEDLRTRPMHARRALLESLLPADRGAAIRPSPTIQTDSWQALTHLRARARDTHNAEGVILKHRDSIYADGRTKPDAGWWKWKLDPRTVDAVLIYSQPGSGKRASLYTDHTFGLWTDDSPTRTLVPFAKAYSGLDADEIERLDRWIRTHTINKRGPFRAVQPAQVFEIAFEGVQESDRHKSGLAVRFPRIAKWRTDKKPDEADTLKTLRALLPD